MPAVLPRGSVNQSFFTPLLADLDRSWPSPPGSRTETAPAVPPFPVWLGQVTPQWQWDWPYLRLIQQKLEQVTTGALKRLMLFLPPRHGKSEQTTIRYPVWRLERDPAFRVAVGCYNQRFAERFGRKARRIARSRLALSDERAAAMEWETAQGGVYRSCGVGNPPTGEGFDLIVIDDPVKSREEADSEAYRERVWEWYTDDLYTRLEPGAALILIQTRWHQEDLAGKLLAEMEQGGEAWEVVSLPAEAEPGDLLGRAPGEPLCPARFDIPALRAIAQVQGHSYSALYQQRPTAKEGKLFKVGMLQFADEAPAGLRRCRAWDLAATQGGGDWTAGVLLGTDDAGRFWVLDVARGQWGPDETDRQVKLTAELDGRGVAIQGAIDPGAAGKRDGRSFVRLLAGWPVSVENVTGPKETRARPFAAQVEAGNVTVLRRPWTKALVEELRTFPQGHDDQADALSDAFQQLTGGLTLSSGAY